MKDLISRCGYKCNFCLAYKDNIISEADRKRFRDGLIKYYGHPLDIEDCYCDGCMADDGENPILLTSDCKVRQCVIKNGFENCAPCDKYPCKNLEARFIDGKKVVKRYGKPVPEEDYNCFIGPYEGKKVLDKIRGISGIK
jgi:hypothetical protein